MHSPTLAAVAARYRYNPETGQLHWVINSYRGLRKVGDTAGGIVGNGYVNARVGSKPYGAHRLAWLLQTGTWPEHEIDHINGDRSDNRWANLRPATRGENACNLAQQQGTKSGLKGIFRLAGGRWWAYITKNGQRKTLGYFQEKGDAIAARAKAEAEIFNDFRRLA